MKNKICRSQVLIFAIIQFVILTLLAMYMYPGGCYHNHDLCTYEFTQNYFSDLGSTHTFRGESNWRSLIFFTIALSSIGVSMISFSFHLKELFTSTVVRRIAKGSLIFSGTSYIMVALFPLNVFTNTHHFFVKCAFTSLLGYVICLIYWQMKSRSQKRYLFLNGFYLLTLMAYIYILFFGPSSHTPDGLTFLVIAQKVIVYFSMINIGIQTWAIFKGFTKSREITP
jgi:hypothetical protein